MSKPIVPRIPFHGDSVATYVRPEDAGRLEAVVEAAVFMRDRVFCFRLPDREAPTREGTWECICSACEAARAFDSALAAVGEGE